MIVSQYTFLFSSLNKDYTYNSLSNSLLEIGHDSFVIIKNAKENHKVITRDDIDAELFDTLVCHHHLVETYKDEFLLYKSVITSLRAQNDFMHLTVAPTTDCNFHCFYCFERHKEPNYMNEVVMDSIVEYIKRISTLKRIKITWFGGEPLMAKKQIKELFQKINAIPNIQIQSSDIITTGYYMDKETIDLFKEAKITAAQITLDGNKTSHNKVKIDSNCSDVFSRVIQNAKQLLESFPDFHITFRINLTKNNKEEYVELYDYLSSEFQGLNVGIAPAFVSDRSSVHHPNNSNLFLNHDESGDFVIDLVTKHGILSPFIQYPETQMCECAIRDKMAMSFDPLGYMYKCWEKIGDRKYAVGRLNEKGEMIDINTKEWNRELYGADPLEDEHCRSCEYLPICHGGCPIMRIQNEFENYNNDVCTIKKGRIEKFLKIHLRLKEHGYNNR